jgi:hypothetical protein
VHAATAIVLVAREKHATDAIVPGWGKLNVGRFAFASEKRIRQLNQDAGAVARERIATARAAVDEIEQNVDSLFDDAVTLSAGNVGNEADATGVVLVTGIVESSTFR